MEASVAAYSNSSFPSAGRDASESLIKALDLLLRKIPRTFIHLICVLFLWDSEMYEDFHGSRYCFQGEPCSSPPSSVNACRSYPHGPRVTLGGPFLHLWSSLREGSHPPPLTAPAWLMGFLFGPKEQLGGVDSGSCL